MVPRAGVEPARPFGQRILSPQRLPFRHPGMLSVTLMYQSFALFAKLSKSSSCGFGAKRRVAGQTSGTAAVFQLRGSRGR